MQRKTSRQFNFKVKEQESRTNKEDKVTEKSSKGSKKSKNASKKRNSLIGFQNFVGDDKSFNFSLNENEEDETPNQSRDFSSFMSKSITPVKRITENLKGADIDDGPSFSKKENGKISNFVQSNSFNHFNF